MIKIMRRVYPNIPAYQRNYYDNAVINQLNPGKDPALKFKETADKLLPDKENDVPKWVNHHDLAIAVASRFPELRHEVDDWVGFHNWKEYWESEQLIIRGDDNPIVLNSRVVENKFDLKDPKKPSEADKKLKPSVRSAKFMEIVDRNSNSEARRVIEIGSGISPILLDWARRGSDYIATGVDYQEEVTMVGSLIAKQYKDKIKGEITFHQENIFADKYRQDSVLNDQYDVCCNFGLIEHFEDKKQKEILELMIRLTKPGGTILIGAPNYWSPSIMQRRWLLHGAARRHDYADHFNLWWPFGYEQPITRLELRKLFEDQTPLVRDIGDTGVTPFHDFEWSEIWKYTKLYGRASWYMPDSEYEKRLLGMIRSISDGDRLEGQYGWIQPLYMPLIYLAGLPPRAISAVLDLFGGVSSKYFGNQVIVWAKKA